MNSITIAGQLGKDAEVRYLPDGSPVSNFSIADNQSKDKETIWWNCQLFGKRAESLAPYLVKGQVVTIIGNITQRKYMDKNGQERLSTDVRISELALHGGRKDQPKEQAKQEESDIPF